MHPSQVIEGSLIVLAVTRGGEDLGAGPSRLRAGDAVLLEGPWAALDAAGRSRDVLVVDSPELVRRQTVPLGKGSRPAIVVLLAMVVLLATGVVPPVIAALLAAGAMIVMRVVTVQQAYRGISWTTVLLVAGMVPMSTAVSTSGAGQDVANVIVDAVGDHGPRVLLAALFVITVIFGQLISNTATALIMIPVALSAAEQLDVSARPVLMSLCVGAAVAFLTPGVDAGEHDGDGSGRLPLRRLLEARPAAGAAVRRGLGAPRPARVAVLTVRGRVRRRDRWSTADGTAQSSPDAAAGLDRLGAGGGVELAVQRLEVRLHRVDRQEQPLAHLGVGQVGRQQLDERQLPTRQADAGPSGRATGLVGAR